MLRFSAGQVCRAANRSRPEMALRRSITVGNSQGLISKRQALAVLGASKRSKAIPQR